MTGRRVSIRYPSAIPGVMVERRLVNGYMNGSYWMVSVKRRWVGIGTWRDYRRWGR